MMVVDVAILNNFSRKNGDIKTIYIIHAARRGAWVRREDERREEDSRANWLANVRMRGVFRARENL